MSVLVKYKGNFVVRKPYEQGRHEWIENMDVREDDVFIAGFPKSGITWAIEITYLLMHDVDISKAQAANQETRVPYLEYPPPQTVQDVVNLPSPRLLKSHLPRHLLPKQIKEKKNKIIYIIRNVKDTSVSLYHFMKFMKHFQFQGNFDDAFKQFVKGEVLNGPWWDSVASYWNARHEGNILFLNYEDLKANPEAEIRRIAQFLNKDLTHDGLQKIKEYCSFENMKDNGRANFSHLVSKNVMTKERAENGLMRKGVIGDWRNYYTEKMSQEIDKLTEEKLGPLGLRFDYIAQKWNFSAKV